MIDDPDIFRAAKLLIDQHSTRAVSCASYCGISENLFRATIMKAVLPLRIGSRVLMDVRSLDTWLAKQTALTPAQGQKDWAALLDEEKDQ